MMLSKLRDMLKDHEGLRLKAYKCPANKWTIGYGRNLEDRGISEAEAEYLLDNDIAEVVVGLKRALPYWSDLSEERQTVLADMCFNLGLQGLLGFKRMLLAVEAEDFGLAASEMLDSRWATQVGGRADKLACIMRTGIYLNVGYVK